MDNKLFDSELRYMALSHIAANVRLKGLLTEEEMTQIDTILREKYRPVFGIIDT